MFINMVDISHLTVSLNKVFLFLLGVPLKQKQSSVMRSIHYIILRNGVNTECDICFWWKRHYLATVVCSIVPSVGRVVSGKKK